MKFWKSLSNLIDETLPDWRNSFLSYKDLKKQLKLIYPYPKDGDKPPTKRPRLSDGEGVGGDLYIGENSENFAVEKEVTDFVRLLKNEVDKFNGFVIEKEEEYIIKWKEVQDRAVKAKESNGDLTEIGREIVDFHGEMVLLENYSILNYTGLVKIIKKYDKRSGALIRLPFVQSVLQQPFFSTDVLNKLIKECEMMHDHLFPKNESPESLKVLHVREEGEPMTATDNRERLLQVPKELAEIEHMESTYVRLTLSALRVLKQIRGTSSTVSVFSLPPLQNNNAVEDTKSVSDS